MEEQTQTQTQTEKLKEISVKELATEVVDSVKVTTEELIENINSFCFGDFWPNKDIFYKEYTAEDLNDIMEDINETLTEAKLPEEDGITKGTFIVKVEWIDE